MTPEQQHEAFERPPKGTRKVVLSTNIAEASVTIDDVVYVIDTGVRKERSYDAGTGISSLDAKMVTKANAIQRRGRAGRCQEGLVVHLFPSFKFKDFEQFPIPQMLSSSMEEVVLQSKANKPTEPTGSRCSGRAGYEPLQCSTADRVPKSPVGWSPGRSAERHAHPKCLRRNQSV
ncbi:ATP-dependent RNA helicase DHX30 (DEAH box protein 30) [Durusdinium trenchii]|uniref:ATP-dependent RNA helicase DHX30 (DEAH box protein 30) n=1 Tax=Durusdinium trenchii TaxID=1381693 RepID=A0ABP0RCM9_9DINO